MTDSVEKRRKFIINLVFYVLIFGAIYLFLRFAFWPTSPFLFAFFFAMIMQKPVNLITKKTPVKRGLASFIVTLLSLLIVVGLLVLAGTRIVSEIKGFIVYLRSTFDNLPGFISAARTWTFDRIASMPKVISNAASPYVEKFFNTLMGSFAESESAIAQARATGASLPAGLNLSSLLKPLSGTVSGVLSTASKLPSKIIAVIVGFIACCFITSDYTKITSFIKRQLSPAKSKALSQTKSLTLATMGKMAKAYCIIIAITFTEIALGLSILSLFKIYKGGYIPLIALGIAIVDILPILGSGTVLIPWAVICLVTGNVSLFFGLLIMYVIITVLRQFIEPRLVAGQLGLPPIVTLIGMYFGLKLFSVPGMFVVPLTVNVLKVLNDEGVVSIWKTTDDKPDISTAPVIAPVPVLAKVKARVINKTVSTKGKDKGNE